jgi:hypothetical protein
VNPIGLAAALVLLLNWRSRLGVQAGDFADPRFVEFAKRVFPNDPEIRRLGSPAEHD